MQIRNLSNRDLEVFGRVYPAGETVDVGPGEAEYLSSNPNFESVDVNSAAVDVGSGAVDELVSGSGEAHPDASGVDAVDAEVSSNSKRPKAGKRG